MHDSTARRRVRAFRESTRDDQGVPDDGDRTPREGFDPRAQGYCDGPAYRAWLIGQGQLRPAADEPTVHTSDKPTLVLDARGRRVAARRVAAAQRGEWDDELDERPHGARP